MRRPWATRRGRIESVDGEASGRRRGTTTATTKLTPVGHVQTFRRHQAGLLEQVARQHPYHCAWGRAAGNLVNPELERHSLESLADERSEPLRPRHRKSV